ncbi:MAG: YidC/Oxa1 family membrane protein insertase [Acidobacteriota bacterium]
MIFWDQAVDFLQSMIFAYAQASGGNLGAGILATSIVVRLALFPLTLRLARLAAAHQEAMRKLQPELDRIRQRFAKKPERIAAESLELFEKNNVSPYPLPGCFGALAQAPIFLAVYSAVQNVVTAGGRFLWIKNLAKPDAWLTLAVAALTYLSVAISVSGTPPQPGRSLVLVLPVVVTVMVLAKASAGVGLYWGVSAAASAVQAYVVRRSTPAGRAS